MIKRTVLLPVLLLLLGVAGACAPTPITLSPAGQTAWRQHEIQKDLDLVRDLAQDANATVDAAGTPLMSTAATRAVTNWHTTAIKLVHDAPAGWKVTLQTSLDELKRDLPPADYAVIGHYVPLVQAALKELP